MSSDVRLVARCLCVLAAAGRNVCAALRARQVEYLLDLFVFFLSTVLPRVVCVYWELVSFVSNSLDILHHQNNHKAQAAAEPSGSQISRYTESKGKHRVKIELFDGTLCLYGPSKGSAGGVSIRLVRIFLSTVLSCVWSGSRVQEVRYLRLSFPMLSFRFLTFDF